MKLSFDGYYTQILWQKFSKQEFDIIHDYTEKNYKQLRYKTPEKAVNGILHEEWGKCLAGRYRSGVWVAYPTQGQYEVDRKDFQRKKSKIMSLLNRDYASPDFNVTGLIWNKDSPEISAYISGKWDKIPIVQLHTEVLPLLCHSEADDAVYFVVVQNRASIFYDIDSNSLNNEDEFDYTMLSVELSDLSGNHFDICSDTLFIMQRVQYLKTPLTYDQLRLWEFTFQGAFWIVK